MSFVPIIVIFCLSLGLIWAAIYFGGRWYKRHQETQASAASDALEKMFIMTGAERIQRLSLVVTILAPVAIWIFSQNLVLVIIAALGAFWAPKYVLRFLQRKRLERIEIQLPDSLMMITSAMKAGASLSMALEGAARDGQAPLSQEFELLLREVRVGVDFRMALVNLERRVPLEDMTMVTAAMALAREVGANLSETLEAVADTLRSKIKMEGKIRSLTAQGKMQGIVMAALPFVLMLVLRFMEPEAMAPLFDTWYGWITLTCVILADLVGYLFIRKIVNIDI